MRVRPRRVCRLVFLCWEQHGCHARQRTRMAGELHEGRGARGVAGRRRAGSQRTGRLARQILDFDLDRLRQRNATAGNGKSTTSRLISRASSCSACGCTSDAGWSVSVGRGIPGQRRVLVVVVMMLPRLVQLVQKHVQHRRAGRDQVRGQPQQHDERADTERAVERHRANATGTGPIRQRAPRREPSRQPALPADRTASRQPGHPSNAPLGRHSCIHASASSRQADPGPARRFVTCGWASWAFTGTHGRSNQG